MPDIFHKKNPKTNFVGGGKKDDEGSSKEGKKDAQKVNAAASITNGLFDISKIKNKKIFNHCLLFKERRWPKNSLTYKIKNYSPDMQDSREIE
jgi:hypothetical protein